MSNELLELAERCEKATGPDEAIDRAIGKIGSRFGEQPKFTASLDTAMTLVPEGWSHGYNWNNRHQNAQAHCELIPQAPFAPADLLMCNSGKCATPALALCAAALRARSAS